MENYAPLPLTYNIVELGGNILAQKIAKKTNHRGKLLGFEFVVKTVLLTKNVFDIPSPTLKHLVCHTHVDLC